MRNALAPSKKAVYPLPFFTAMAATLLLFFSFQALLPTFPLYVTALDGSAADNGLCTWALALAALVTRPLAGMLADRRGRKPVLAVGALLFGGAPLLYALAPNIPWLLGARVVQGVGIALFSTSYQAFMVDLLPPDRYGEGLGLAGIPTSLAMIAAPLFGEWVVARFGFAWSFGGLSAIGGAGAAIALSLPGRRRDAAAASAIPSTGQAGLGAALRQPAVRAGAMGMAFLGLPLGAFFTFLPLLTESRGLGGSGLVFAAYAIASSLAMPLAGRAADRWGAKGTALAGLGLAGLGGVGIALAADRWVLVGAAALMGCGAALTPVALGAWMQRGLEVAQRGSAAAIQYASFDLLVGLGSWALGWLTGEAGYAIMYATAAALALLGLLIGLATWGRQEPPGEAVQT